MQTIIITGASRRLGLYLTEQFLQNNWHVIAISRGISNELASLKCDALTLHTVESYRIDHLDAVIQSIHSSVKKIDVIVHNASRYEPDPDSDEFPLDYYADLFQVHMVTPAYINASLADLLHDEANPGNIIHITDIYAENPKADYSLYCSTKAGLENLTKSLAKKYAPGIRVNSIQPGPIKFLPEHNEDHKEQVMKETLLKYEGGFSALYKAVLAILDNHYMTGGHIKVDGGRHIGKH